MNRLMNAGLLVSLCIVMPCAALGDDEAKLSPGDVPGPVAAAAAKEFPKAKISGWTKETEDGKVTYEAVMTEGAAKREVSFSGQGEVLSVEEAMKISQLPAAVKTAVHEKYALATISKAEKVIHDATTQYEVTLKNSAKKEVLFDANGTLVKEE